MKVFTLYYDRYKTATTSKALHEANIDHYVMCHNNSEKFENIYGEIVESNKPKVIQHNLNSCINLLEYNEWAIIMSDDYTESYKIENKEFVKSNLAYVYNELKRHTKIADQIGVKLIGLNSSGNALYAQKNYGKYGLVDGRMFAIKKTEFKWLEDINCITDYYATVYHLNKYGGNLILQWCYADFKRYEKDGIGTAEARKEIKKNDIFILKNLYPKNIIIKDKKGQPKGKHIIIKK
jgi:hypothetical protein